MQRYFFSEQQEFRIILHEELITEPRNFKITKLTNTKIYSLEDFFKGIDVNTLWNQIIFTEDALQLT